MISSHLIAISPTSNGNRNLVRPNDRQEAILIRDWRYVFPEAFVGITFLSKENTLRVGRDVGSKTTYAFGKGARPCRNCLPFLAAVDEVIYKLRAILISVSHTGLVRANEEFTKWLSCEKTIPFGENNRHVPVRLIDLENPANNETGQFSV